jgi:hypothetical protein
MLKPAPKALIDGRLVRPGERVAGFVLKSVGHRTVRIERDGVVVELEM